jgi:hypothetical protein
MPSHSMTRELKEAASAHAAIVQQCNTFHVPYKVTCGSERHDGSMTRTEIDLLFFISIFLIIGCFSVGICFVLLEHIIVLILLQNIVSHLSPNMAISMSTHQMFCYFCFVCNVSICFLLFKHITVLILLQKNSGKTSQAQQSHVHELAHQHIYAFFCFKLCVYAHASTSEPCGPC